MNDSLLNLFAFVHSQKKKIHPSSPAKWQKGKELTDSKPVKADFVIIHALLFKNVAPPGDVEKLIIF